MYNTTESFSNHEDCGVKCTLLHMLAGFRQFGVYTDILFAKKMFTKKSQVLNVNN